MIEINQEFIEKAAKYHENLSFSDVAMALGIDKEEYCKVLKDNEELRNVVRRAYLNKHWEIRNRLKQVFV